MNPLDYWIEKDNNLNHYLTGYYSRSIEKGRKFLSDNLQNDIKWLFTSGSAVEKTMVLTVLSAVNLYMR